MQNRDNITLIGMPGAGKSTLGVVLAKKLGYRFVDTDLLIQEAEGKLLSEIIQERGVEGFIACENELISKIDLDRHVIATGGSAIYGSEAMARLKELGKIIYLKASLEEIEKRLDPDLVMRGVAIREGSTLEDLYRERAPLYKQAADFIIDVDSADTRECLDMLMRVIGKAAPDGADTLESA